MIHYVSEKTSRGDIGPCAMRGCPNRARVVLTLAVDGADCVTWLCEAHTAPFRKKGRRAA